MAIQDTSNNSQFTFKADLEGKPNEKLDLAIYLFSSEGTFITAAPMRQGEARFNVDEALLRYAQIMVGPALPQERMTMKPTPDTLARLRAHSPVWRYERGKTSYDLGLIPELYWHNWLWCKCPVRGRVVKPVWTGGVYIELHVCNARVHICEVDRIPLVIVKLPDRDIYRLRDDLLKKLAEIPRIPIPDPEPWPILSSNIDPLASYKEAVGVFGNQKAADLNPQPLPPVARNRVLHHHEEMVFDPQPEPPALMVSSLKKQRTQLPALIDRLDIEKMSALTSNSLSIVRQALIDNLVLIRPYLCEWKWLWPYFYTCDELATTLTDEQGRFQTNIWHLCAGDHPDIYFWVESSIGGTWETVYRPSIACHTYWNYVCGTDIKIRVTDPRVTGCGHAPEVFGKKIIIKTIGHSISMGEIVRESMGSDPEEGLFVRDPSDWILGIKKSPFGGTLEPRIDFGNGITPAIATHYRWSYRKLGSMLDSDWKVLDQPVSRHYREASGLGSPTIYKSALVGPDPATAGLFYKIRPDLPAGGEDWEMLYERYDLASAYFETSTLPDQGIKYELKLELFKPSGAVMERVDLTAAGIEIYEITDPAPLTSGSYVTTAPTADRVLTAPAVPSPHNVGYRLVLHVDNRPCFATIQEEVVTGGQGAGRCGFIEYLPGNNVTLSFRASHPGNFAWFDFSSVRVTEALPSASASGFVDVVAANGFNRAGDTFSKAIPVATLLTENEVVPEGEASCTRAAFAEVLHVYALAGDGYARLSYLDAPRATVPPEAPQIGTRAFAITPK